MEQRRKGPLPVTEERVGRREIDLNQREIELAQRELELARREIAFLRSTSVPVAESRRKRRVEGAAMKVNINTVAELLEDFSEGGEAYDNWEKAEHVEMPLVELLANLRSMFAHRSNKVAKRKLFENRIWKRGEAFGDYLHDKIIMANQVPVDDSEIVDYVIEGIPDPSLKDQARIQRFESTAELLRAFEKVTLRSRGQPDGTGVEDRGPRQKKEERGAPANDRKCYNCGQ
ncbi:hypothetical protein RF55_11159 [Lasius niger]|uniref:Uncharacterized protein n=1 Tax=Lasius niger TaxID=67767 RepID=A0A0J7KG58_LASNI|nr:hypothetical protein RF55_11159 [Lasius niger]